MDLARGARERGWWEQYKGVFTGAYVGLEAEASSINTFEPLVIPGLLQTPVYTAELTRASLVRDPAEIDKHVEARMRRQEILRRPNPPRYWAVEARHLARILDHSPELAATTRHVHDFAMMMTERQGHHLGGWITALHSLARFCQRISGAGH